MGDISRPQMRRYLRQYLRAKARRDELERLKANIRLAYKAKSTPVSEARMQETDDRIRRQSERVEQTITQLLDVIDLLPQLSDERRIIEMRYVQGLSWGVIERSASMSRSRASWYEANAIDTLREYEQVQELVALMPPVLDD